MLNPSTACPKQYRTSLKIRYPGQRLTKTTVFEAFPEASGIVAVQILEPDLYVVLPPADGIARPSVG